VQLTAKLEKSALVMGARAWSWLATGEADTVALPKAAMRLMICVDFILCLLDEMRRRKT
jgi:hypothetical protein